MGLGSFGNSSMPGRRLWRRVRNRPDDEVGRTEMGRTVWLLA
jgi:hypothetical protein